MGFAWLSGVLQSPAHLTERKTIFRQRRRSGIYILLCIAGWFLADGLKCGAQGTLTWSNVFAGIEQKWPSVPQMGTEELQRQLELPAENHPLVIDVRSREEFNVSHLPGALWAESPAAIRDAIRDAPSQRSVVLYCSVGVRSSQAAARIIQAGRTNVFNLKGSIFQWANEGRRVEKAGKAVSEVHPYNKRWGQLLDQAHHPKESN